MGQREAKIPHLVVDVGAVRRGLWRPGCAAVWSSEKSDREPPIADLSTDSLRGSERGRSEPASTAGAAQPWLSQ